MKVKGKRILKNGAVGAYVYYKKEKKWKWRIVEGPKKKKPQSGGAQFIPTENLFFKKIQVNNNNNSRNILSNNDQSIILIPGWLCDAKNSYENLLTYFKHLKIIEKNNIYLYDPPGVGVNKDYIHIPNKNQCGIVAQALSLVHLITKNKISNINLVGHSIGAIVALLTNMFLKDNNIRVNSVTLLDPTPPNSKNSNIQQESINIVCKLRLNKRNKIINEALLGKFILPKVRRYPLKISNEALTVSINTVCQTFDGMTQILSRRILTNLINELPENSQILLPRGVRRYLNMNENKIHTIHTDGHFIQQDDSMNVAKFIINLIEPTIK